MPHMLAPRSGCLDYSKVYSNDTERWLLAWNKNNIYYILYISYTMELYYEREQHTIFLLM